MLAKIYLCSPIGMCAQIYPRVSRVSLGYVCRFCPSNSLGICLQWSYVWDQACNRFVPVTPADCAHLFTLSFNTILPTWDSCCCCLASIICHIPLLFGSIFHTSQQRCLLFCYIVFHVLWESDLSLYVTLSVKPQNPAAAWMVHLNFAT